MTNEQRHSDTGLFAGVDLRAFWETLRLRWWVIPAVIAVSVGFLWAQESDLQTVPTAYEITQVFEARDPTGVLASVGIDPAAVRPFPDASNQLRFLQGSDVREEIAAKIGGDITVTVTRDQPSFTLVDTLENDGKSSFVFQSMGTPTYSYFCVEPARSTCENAIAAYVDKTMELRRAAFTAGLNDLKSVLEATRSVNGDVALDGKIAAVTVLLSRLDVPMVKIDEIEETVGDTVGTVSDTTYFFGMIAGLLVGLLITLQLTYSDRKIRSERQVVRAVGESAFLGTVNNDAAPSASVSERRTAVSLHDARTATSAKSFRFIPLRNPLRDTVSLERVRTTSGAPGSITKPFVELSVSDLTSLSDDVDVLVVQRNDDLRSDLVEASAALRRGGRRFGGVLLLD